MKKKLLLADDSITIQKVVGMIFAAEDYELLIAGDGDTAYDMALVNKPDLVIADVSMPGRDGFELCRVLKSHPALAATSVMLLSGAFEVFDEEKAAVVRADGWLVKPFESKILLDKVDVLLSIEPLRLEPANNYFEEPATVQQDVFSAGNGLLDDAEELPDVPVEEELSIEDKDDIWGSVSFEEENLKPHDLFAATDDDDDDSEQEMESPLNVPWSVELPDGLNFGSEVDEDELVELMEDDLLDEDGLVEDKETFVGHDEDDADDFDAEGNADNEILDLTESEIVESTDAAAEHPLEVETHVSSENINEFFAADSFIEKAEPVEKAEPLWPDDDTDEDSGTQFADEEDKDFIFGVNDDTSTPAEMTSEEDAPGFVFTDAKEVPVVEPSDAQDHNFTFVDDQDSVGTDSDFPEEDAAPEFAYVASKEVDVKGQDDDVNSLSGTFTPPAPDQQIEAQLSALSEEELKQIVERVAGPMIEKLAKELLEKMAWEVVPDLAEAIIREEIEKIKAGNN